MEDRRKRYTKMVLKEELLKKLREKPLSRVTVTELCKEADINRATYYAHYDNPYDQMQKMEQEYMDGIADIFETPVKGGGEASILAMVEAIMVHAKENEDLLKILLAQGSGSDFVVHYMDFIRPYVAKVANFDKRFPDDTERQSVYEFTSAGSIGVVRSWLFNEEDTRTPRQMAEFLVRLSSQ